MRRKFLWITFCGFLLFLTVCSCGRKEIMEPVEYLEIETIIERNGFDLGEYGIIGRPPTGPLFRVLEIQRIAPGGKIEGGYGGITLRYPWIEKSDEETILIWTQDESGGVCTLILRPRSCPTTARIEDELAAIARRCGDCPTAEIEESNASPQN